MRKNFKAVLFAGSAITLAFGSAGVVQAAEAEDQADVAASQGVGEIIVTAQRRSENLQSVPIAITAINADMAREQGVTRSSDLIAVVPGLTVPVTPGTGGTPYLRGVGSPQTAPGTEGPVALYVDGVYIGATQSNIFNFNNIESISVLKGPQGTLFGRNATGGVIQVTTKVPSFSGLEGEARVGYGNYDTVEGSLYVNVPVSEKVALNFAAMGKNQDNGYGFNAATGEDIWKEWNYGLRGGLRFQPSDATDIQLRGDYYEYKGDIGSSVHLREGSVGPLGTVNLGRYTASIAGDPQPMGMGKTYGVSLTVEQDMGGARLRSISAYRNNRTRTLLNIAGGFPNVLDADLNYFTRNYTQEFHILSPDSSRLNWIVGAFYLNSSSGFDPFRISGSGVPAASNLTVTQDLESIAVFGEVKYDVLPETNLTLGLRYTHDSYDIVGDRRLDNGFVVPGSAVDKKSSGGKLTYRAVLDHHFTPDVMAYASLARGFKSGGFNTTSPNDPAVEPEVIDAYEIGLKTTLFDRRLRLNLSAFHYDYSNLQVQVLPEGVAQTINAGKARIRGFDADIVFKPSSRFTLSGGFSILDGEYTEFDDGPVLVPLPATCTPVPQTTGTPTGSNLQCAADLAGNSTVYSPKFTSTVTAAYTLPTEVGEFLLSATYYHNSGFFTEPDNRLRQESYDTLNATLGWTSPDGRFGIDVWGRNLTDEYYYLYSAAAVSGDNVLPAMPANYGVTLKAKF